MADDFAVVVWCVEHGSAAFATCPNGKTLMFDAGCSSRFSPALLLKQNYGYDPVRNRLDHLTISHADQDHINDLPNVSTHLNPRIFRRNKTVPPHLIYGSNGHPQTAAKLAYKAMDERYTAPVNPEDAFAPASNWGGVQNTAFIVDAGHHPEYGQNGATNNYSVVALARYGDTVVVFPGDIEGAGMCLLLQESPAMLAQIESAPIRVLVAPHHGREAGVCTEFLERMRPDLTIMSDCWRNETTDAETYRRYTSGWPVYHSETKKTEKRYVLTTKTNDFVLIKAGWTGLTVAV